jgi:flagellar basal body-associated protein FliL
MSGAATHGRSNRWTKLIVLLIAVIVLFVALSIYAAHLASNHNNHSGASVTRTTVVLHPGDLSGITTLRL